MVSDDIFWTTKHLSVNALPFLSIRRYLPVQSTTFLNQTSKLHILKATAIAMDHSPALGRPQLARQQLDVAEALTDQGGYGSLREEKTKCTQQQTRSTHPQEPRGGTPVCGWTRDKFTIHTKTSHSGFRAVENVSSSTQTTSEEEAEAPVTGQLYS